MDEVSWPGVGAVVITEQIRARPAKTFLLVCAAAIHLQSFNNSHPLLRWDVEQA
jgi:hypothetical protein